MIYNDDEYVILEDCNDLAVAIHPGSCINHIEDCKPDKCMIGMCQSEVEWAIVFHTESGMAVHTHICQIHFLIVQVMTVEALHN